MPDGRKDITHRDADQSRRQRWTPVYPIYPNGHIRAGRQIMNALPIDWRCPCGAMLGGGKSCPKCGRVILDGIEKIDQPQYIKDSRDGRHWKAFAKRTGRR